LAGSDISDALGSTYLLGDVVVELHASCQWCQILGISPTLQFVRPVAKMSMVVPLAVMSFLNLSQKNLLRLIPVLSPTSMAPSSSASGGVPRYAFMCLCSTRTMVCHVAIDLAIVALLLERMICHYCCLHGGYLVVISSSIGYFVAVVVGHGRSSTDALLQWVSSLLPRWMLCHRWIASWQILGCRVLCRLMLYHHSCWMLASLFWLILCH
jgi:hypothetical protein